MYWGATEREATEESITACVGAGWHGLLRRLMADLLALGWDGCIFQVKEKFGGLRFYIGSASDAVHDRIEEAEKESYTICEACGAPGKLRDDRYWIVTSCDECDKKNKERNTE